MSEDMHVTAQDFDDIVQKAGVPVLVDFWAEWCGPCKMLSPVLDELAAEYGEKVKIAKVNVDQQPNLAARYGIRSIPTIILFRGGEIAEQMVGMQPKEALKAKLDSLL
ncbi:MAG: thioredoxin [Deltaproteobacteria bacterium]|nr:thioredoxin [Deltaproteobacteria bacterium]